MHGGDARRRDRGRRARLRARQTRRATLHGLLERLAAHELHPQSDAIIVLLGAVDLHDVRVAHARKPPRLLEDPRVRLAPIALVVEQLERDVAVERRVPRAKDLAGRAVPDAIEEREPAPMRPGRARPASRRSVPAG